MIIRYRFVALLVLLFIHHAPVLGQGFADWQQHVRYEMDVTLYPDQHQMQGRQTLHYANHSPDTLTRVFYHLYFNAFQPHSMMAERNRHLPDPDPRIVPRIFELGPEEIGFHRIESLTQDGAPVEYSIFDTVMDVELANPILPGESVEFDMSFQSQIPLQTRRSGRDNLEGIDYSMSQWYPKMANYDERGWHADPYVGREFYAPFGTFDVRITLPAEYIIGSTGVLQNPDEIGYGYSPTAMAVGGDSLTWHFLAEGVHDFAWAADPDFVHDVLETEEGTTIHLLYQPDVAETWQRLHEWAPEIMSFFGSEYGTYLYPQMTIVQAGDGGMEYPMITFLTGRRPPASLLGVTAHEVAHMWFYGMMGTNEADYAWIDEGFASYATTEVISHIQGNPNPSHVPAFLGVLQAKHFGLFEPLNTSSDWFQTGFAYSNAAYSGGEMLLDMLGYVISDSLRDRFLHAYHERFAMRHSNPFDIEKVAEDVSGMQLDWYFEQFGNSTWDLDYALGGLRSTREGDEWRTVLTLKRNAPAVMPVDVRLTLEDGSSRWINVPLSIMQGQKPVGDDWTVAEPWAWTSPEYTLEVTSPARAVRAEIDPLMRTPESTRLNNVTGIPLGVAFLQPPGQSWSRYQVGWRPLAHYAHNWGFGGGLQFRGMYLFDRYAAMATLKFWPEVVFSSGEGPDVDGFSTESFERHSPVDGIDYDLSVSDNFSGGPLVRWTLRSRKHLGILQNDAQISLLFDPTDLLRARQHRLTVGLRHQHRTSDRSFFNQVSEGFIPEAVLSAHARLARTGTFYRYVLAGETGGGLKGRGDTRTANRLWVDLARGVPLGRFTGSFRLLAGVGDQHLARHKLFRLGSAPFEDQWANAAYRVIGGAFKDPLGDAHWVALGAPGPVADVRREQENADIVTGANAGPHIAAVSARLLTPWLSGSALFRPLRAELFVGAGRTWNGNWLSDFDVDRLVMDAGFGLRYDFRRVTALDRWINQSDVLSNLTLTARFPFWASDPIQIDGREEIGFRWLVGVLIDDLAWY